MTSRGTWNLQCEFKYMSDDFLRTTCDRPVRARDGLHSKDAHARTHTCNDKAHIHPRVHANASSQDLYPSIMLCVQLGKNEGGVRVCAHVSMHNTTYVYLCVRDSVCVCVCVCVRACVRACACVCVCTYERA